MVAIVDSFKELMAKEIIYLLMESFLVFFFFFYF